MNLRAKLLVPVIGAIGLLLLAFLVVFLRNQGQNRASVAAEQAREAGYAFREQIDESARTMESMLRVLAMDERLMAAFLAGDRAALLVRAAPVLETLRRGLGVTHLYFHRRDRTNLLRVHHPEDHDDLINRATLREAERTGRPASGLERGPIGTFVLRVVLPWRDGDEVVGYLELGTEFMDIARAVRQSHAIDVIVALDKRQLDREQWERSLRALGKNVAWTRYPDVVVGDQTVQDIPSGVDRWLAAGTREGATGPAQVEHGGRVLQVTYLPLQGPDHVAVGQLIALRDITAGLDAERRAIATVVAACALVAAVLFAFFWIFVGRIEASLVGHARRLEENAALPRSGGEA